MLNIGSVGYMFGGLTGRLAVVRRKARSLSEIQYEWTYALFVL